MRYAHILVRFPKHRFPGLAAVSDLENLAQVVVVLTVHTKGVQKRTSKLVVGLAWEY